MNSAPKFPKPYPSSPPFTILIPNASGGSGEARSPILVVGCGIHPSLYRAFENGSQKMEPLPQRCQSWWPFYPPTSCLLEASSRTRRIVDVHSICRSEWYLVQFQYLCLQLGLRIELAPSSTRATYGCCTLTINIHDLREGSGKVVNGMLSRLSSLQCVDQTRSTRWLIPCSAVSKSLSSHLASILHVPAGLYFSPFLKGNAKCFNPYIPRDTCAAELMRRIFALYPGRQLPMDAASLKPASWTVFLCLSRPRSQPRPPFQTRG